MNVLGVIHRIIWGPWTLLLFLGTGIWFSIRLHFFQITGFTVWWRQTAGSLLKPPDDSAHGRRTGISSFQSACTALAATVGTGNIAGVATALTAGGPGTVFWMWIAAAAGMMTAYAEVYLGQKYRFQDRDGVWICGPMVYMERGLRVPEMSKLYAVFAILASFGMGNMVQANAISSTIRYHLPQLPAVGWWIGIGLEIGSGIMILGGIRRIARFSGVLMPVSAGIYFLFSMIVILASRELLPDIFRTILKEALRPEAAAGGIGGTMISAGMRYGLSRGTFSNEAGLGSLAVLHGTPENTTPEQQGMWAMFAVFLDTMVLCTLTALVVLCTAASGQLPAGLDGAALAAWCYARRLGVSGTVLVSGAMAVFAFATIVAWYYVGEQMVDYLQRKAGTRWQHIPAGSIYRGLYLAMVCLGCVSSVRAVWMISDIWNGCMAFPNLLALLLLSRQVKRPGGKVGCT